MRLGCPNDVRAPVEHMPLISDGGTRMLLCVCTCPSSIVLSHTIRKLRESGPSTHRTHLQTFPSGPDPKISEPETGGRDETSSYEKGTTGTSPFSPPIKIFEIRKIWPSLHHGGVVTDREDCGLDHRHVHRASPSHSVHRQSQVLAVWIDLPSRGVDRRHSRAERIDRI